MFTPQDAHTYAVVELTLPVDTQIGVTVSITADSRDYVKGSTAATGQYTLTDTATGDALTGVSLTGATYGLPPGGRRVTTCSSPVRAMPLTVPAGEESLYALQNAYRDGEGEYPVDHAHADRADGVRLPTGTCYGTLRLPAVPRNTRARTCPAPGRGAAPAYTVDQVGAPVPQRGVHARRFRGI